MILRAMHTLKILRILLLVILVASPLRVFAADMAVTPVVVDDKAKARDILKRSITIQNTSNHKLQVYPTVNDVHPEDGTAPFVSAQSATDRADSLANWIELSRGMIEMNPGEEKTIPFVIRVASNAVPAMYHASITLGTGGDRASAEASPPLGTVTINVEVQEDVKEFLQLNRFWTDRLFFSGDDILFNYSVENIGNQELKPHGEIRVYDRHGEEVASVPVNADGKSFSPDKQLQLASVWSGATGFGQYKAFLNIDYGSDQTASVQDTVYFWIVPWQQLLALFIAALVAVVALALYYHRWLEDRHREKFGLAPVATHVEATLGDNARGARKENFPSRVFTRVADLFASMGSRFQQPEKVLQSPRVMRESASTIVTPREPIQPPIVRQSQIPTIQEAHGEVIDLKRMRAKQPDSAVHSEVINLRKRP